MKHFTQVSSIAAAICAVLLTAPAQATIIVSQTTDSATLGGALQGSGVTIDSATVVNGSAVQFGTYTNFTAPPVTFGDGVVMSTGKAVDTAGPASSSNVPSTNLSQSGTAEFDAYGPGHITNFSDSNDVAALKVDFTLASDSAVSFDFIFGSIEYPQYVNSFTDAFLAFLDGTSASDQVVFDSNDKAVQVGSSFASLLTTSDVNTAFGDPHGLIMSLTTTTQILSAGSHTLLFEVGDVNDHILDSAVFLSNLRTNVGGPGTGPSEVPEPGSLALLGLGIATLAAVRRRKAS